jgi:hypothetical protein
VTGEMGALLDRTIDKNRLMRAAAIGAITSVLLVARSYYLDPCLFEWDGVASALILPIVLGILVSVFAWLKTWGRVALVVCLFSGWWALFSGIHSFGRNFAPQSAAVANLRTISMEVENRRTSTGYPDYIPLERFQAQSKHYRLVYTRIKSQPGGPVESFRVSADPIREDCGLRHFLLTQGGTIYATSEPRPATLKDPEI